MWASNLRAFPIMLITLESPDQPDVMALIAELDAYQACIRRKAATSLTWPG